MAAKERREEKVRLWRRAKHVTWMGDQENSQQRNRRSGQVVFRELFPQKYPRLDGDKEWRREENHHGVGQGQ